MFDDDGGDDESSEGEDDEEDMKGIGSDDEQLPTVAQEPESDDTIPIHPPFPIALPEEPQGKFKYAKKPLTKKKQRTLAKVRLPLFYPRFICVINCNFTKFYYLFLSAVI